MDKEHLVPGDIEEGDTCNYCGMGEYWRSEPPKEDAFLYQNLTADQRDNQMFCDVCGHAAFNFEDL